MKKLEGAGLRGQSAGQTSLSTVEQEGSLRYLGYSIEDLAENASFEEVKELQDEGIKTETIPWIKEDEN